MTRQEHTTLIKDQFEKQARAYSQVRSHTESLNLLTELSQVNSKDNVLDLACGSGITTCEFAKYAAHVTGIDITENMLNLARQLQLKNKLTNINWILDDVLPLKFKDEEFTLVITRFSFHHFTDYETVFEEMIRVCKPGGKILIADVSVPEEKALSYDRMEKLRDPSHAAVVSEEKFKQLFNNTQLIKTWHASYDLSIKLEEQLNASFPSLDDKEKLRELILEDFNRDQLGIRLKQEEDDFVINYPIHVYAAEKKTRF